MYEANLLANVKQLITQKQFTILEGFPLDIGTNKQITVKLENGTFATGYSFNVDSPVSVLGFLVKNKWYFIKKESESILNTNILQKSTNSVVNKQSLVKDNLVFWLVNVVPASHNDYSRYGTYTNLYMASKVESIPHTYYGGIGDINSEYYKYYDEKKYNKGLLTDTILSFNKIKDFNILYVSWATDEVFTANEAVINRFRKLGGWLWLTGGLEGVVWNVPSTEALFHEFTNRYLQKIGSSLQIIRDPFKRYVNPAIYPFSFTFSDTLYYKQFASYEQVIGGDIGLYDAINDFYILKIDVANRVIVSVQSITYSYPFEHVGDSVEVWHELFKYLKFIP